MSFLELLEPEEFVGRHWHRLVGDAASYPSYPNAAVAFEEVCDVLSIYFRGLGGAGGIRLAASQQRISRHRLSFRQRLGSMAEKLDRPTFDGETLTLPPHIDLFDDPALNRDAYFWLAAFFVHLPFASPTDADPLRRDLLFIEAARQTTQTPLAACPGLAPRYHRLRDALLAARPIRRLPETEAAVEDLIRNLLNGQASPALLKTALSSHQAPPRYRAFLPVPLWGEIVNRPLQSAFDDPPEETEGGSMEEDDRKRAAERRKLDQTEREDAIILNRFEKMLSFSEMVNLNRATDDDEDENAKQVADAMDEITVSAHKKRTASKLKLDLDLAPNAVDAQTLIGEHLYPEWDYRAGSYHKDHCAVFVQPAPENGENWTPDAGQKRRIRQVRRQFEALRPKRQIHHRQVDGSELDMDALVRSRCDFAASGAASNRIYSAVRNNERDMAVALLVDVSLSTDAWIEGQRVLDVEKEALTALSHGLAACGDDHAIYAFTSRKRKFVRIEEVKGFDAINTAIVDRRIAALKPGYYTRMGAAIRHTARELAKRPNRHRLMLVLTDGKPNDVDHYEGRYGLEDTRRAILDARRNGLTVFGVTVDSQARDYFPHLFGRGAYHIVGHIGKLPAALPKIYGQLIK